MTAYLTCLFCTRSVQMVSERAEQLFLHMPEEKSPLFLWHQTFIPQSTQGCKRLSTQRKARRIFVLTFAGGFATLQSLRRPVIQHLELVHGLLPTFKTDDLSLEDSLISLPLGPVNRSSKVLTCSKQVSLSIIIKHSYLTSQK